MKKVKLEVSHSILDTYGTQLQLLIADLNPNNRRMKIRHILWVKTWLIIQEKGAFAFQGEKKLSLQMEQALAFMDAIELMTAPGEYEQAMFLKHFGEIDQQSTSL